MKPRIFISHSGYVGETRELIEALEHELETADFAPLIDRHAVEPATEFPQVVDWMLAVCDAAIVIVNERALALESMWVFGEASALRPRAFANPGFQIVVLYTDGLSATDLRRSPHDWSITHLVNRSTLPVRADPAETACDAVAQLTATRELIEAGGAERHIRNLLATSGIAPEALRPLGDELAASPVTGEPLAEIARRLVTATTPKPIASFCAKLAKRDLALGLEILQLAFPFAWIHRDAADQIVDALVDRAPLAINSMAHETAKAYTDRSCPALPLWKVHNLAAATSGNVDELLDEAERRLRADDGDLDLDLFAAFDGTARGPLEGIVMLAVPCENGDRDVVQCFTQFAAVRNHVGVILKLGPEATDAAIDALQTDVRYLRPALDIEREAMGLRLFANAIEHVTAQANPEGS